MRTVTVLLLVLLACGESKEDKQKECDDIEANIETAADERGIPRQGACSSQAALADENIRAACDNLAECRQELADM